MRTKIILDVNIWISIFLKNKTGHFLDLFSKNKIELVANAKMREELWDVINRRKFEKSFSAQNIRDGMKVFDIVTTIYSTGITYKGSPDPKDDYLFDLAQQSGTEILVTGDKKLLAFKTGKVEVISMNDFENRFN